MQKCGVAKAFLDDLLLVSNHNRKIKPSRNTKIDIVISDDRVKETVRDTEDTDDFAIRKRSQGRQFISTDLNVSVFSGKDALY